MTSFAQWVKQQESDRETELGYFARYWALVTPGRISTPKGMQGVLEKLRDKYAEEEDTEQLGYLSMAMRGLTAAVEGYHAHQQAEAQADLKAVEQPAGQPDAGPAEVAGLVPLAQRSPNGLSPAERLKQLAESGSNVTAMPDRSIGSPVTLASLSARIDAVAGMTAANQRLLEQVWAQNEAILTYQVKTLDAVDPEPVDWDWLWSQAREAYEDEAFPKGHAQ